MDQNIPQSDSHSILANAKDDWRRDQIKRYALERPTFVLYADILNSTLSSAINSHAPLAFVETRAKEVSSFAEKLIRKAEKYSDPLNQITDLCAGRVIVHTKLEADRISAFVRTTFHVDHENSLDTKDRLSADQFGYTSMHFVVRLNSQMLPDVDSKVLELIGTRPAEIQVRTLLQHVWANIGHDRLYKSALHIPLEWSRDAARLAALLEEADAGFTRLVSHFESFKTHFGVCLDAATAGREVTMLKSIMANSHIDSDKAMAALRIAKVLIPRAEYQEVILNLEPVLDISCPQQMLIKTEMGYSLCSSSDSVTSRDFKRGQSILAQVASLDDGNDQNSQINSDSLEWRTRAIYFLALTYLRSQPNEAKGHQLIQQAFQRDPGNPYILSALLECESRFRQDTTTLEILRPSIDAAIDLCKAHACAGIELPFAYFTIGRLSLLLDKPYNALKAYLKAVELCIHKRAFAPASAFESERVFLHRVYRVKELPDTYLWVDLLLGMAESVLFGVDVPNCELSEYCQVKSPILIVAGSTKPESDGSMAEFQDALSIALQHFSGTVISGGTSTGVCGAVGVISDRFTKSNARRYKLNGYLPDSLPPNAHASSDYDQLIRTGGKTFSPLEPLIYWRDILASGIKPQNVKLIAINGGEITGFELRLALALGAKVGVLNQMGGTSSELLLDPDWRDASNISTLPLDGMVLRAFVDQVVSNSIQRQIDPLAEAIHGKYVQENRHKSTDLAMRPWGSLSPDLQESNRNQVAYALKILDYAGFDIRASENPVPPMFYDVEVEIMAEMEHGRWVVERLDSGWIYAPTRDVEKKLSPYLIGWSDLDDSVKGWDRDMVCEWPNVFASAGLEIIRR